MKLSVGFCILAAFQAVFVITLAPAAAGLTEGYYKTRCNDDVERIVREVVTKAVAADRGKGAGLIRLLFHDSFVRGSDASVLLDKDADGNAATEKSADANLGLRGLDVIDAAKTAVEDKCPGIVSCADIIAFAARDAAKFLSGNTINYNVAGGRLDGVISRKAEAASNLPGASFNLSQLINNYKAKGFSTTDLVTLSGAHSIGISHCSSFKDRRDANDAHMNALYRELLKKDCSNPDSTVVQNVRDLSPADVATKLAGVDIGKLHDVRSILDNSYYANNLNNLVLFNSDWELVTSTETLKLMDDYAKNPAKWSNAFGEAMRRLSEILPPDGSTGEIRNKCSAVNKP